jgi:hypothetical protein
MIPFVRATSRLVTPSKRPVVTFRYNILEDREVKTKGSAMANNTLRLATPEIRRSRRLTWGVDGGLTIVDDPKVYINLSLILLCGDTTMGILSLILSIVLLPFRILDLLLDIILWPFKLLFGWGKPSCPRCGSTNVSQMNNGKGVCGDCGYRGD